MKKQQTDYTVSGVIPLGRKKYTPIDNGTLSYEFHELERIAGVDVIEGRGWYGLRRLTSDLFEELAKTIALETALGTTWMAASTRESMDEIVRRVASPNGTTEAGLAVLGRDDVLDKLVSLTISAASRRAAELAEEAKGPKLASEAPLS